MNRLVVLLVPLLFWSCKVKLHSPAILLADSGSQEEPVELEPPPPINEQCRPDPNDLDTQIQVCKQRPTGIDHSGSAGSGLP